MQSSIIFVENLGKQYTLRHQGAGGGGYRRLSEDFIGAVKKPFRKQVPTSGDRADKEPFWALRNVSFEVNEGEVMGVIGRNGAGKTTLLKILSRITEPTEGRVRLKGRVASLLEVGTGFHPELTGRENIFLNGAILGMSRREIYQKFDEIVAFAEVEKFLDTPVKRYSSGMYVRLAFAVAAHLESEILLVDEVLAVGDVSFQKKSIGKMDEVASVQGRTVLFVSHQLGMISRLCGSCLLLHNGDLVKCGETAQVVEDYLRHDDPGSGLRFVRSQSELRDTLLGIAEAYTCDPHGALSSEFGHEDPITIKVRCQRNHASANLPAGLTLTLAVCDALGRRIFTTQRPLSIPREGLSALLATVRVPARFLVPGHYAFIVNLNVPPSKIVDRVEEICRFTITDAGSEFAAYEGRDYGCVFADCDWAMEFQPPETR